MSTPENATVGPAIPAGSLGFVNTPQTSCVPANPNGRLVATPSTAGGEPAAGYTFRWFLGQFAPGANPMGPGLPATSTATSSTLSGLAAGAYTVFYVNGDNGCQNQAEATVVEMLSDPILDVPTTTPLTSCSMPDGSASSAVGGVTAGFDFYWFDSVLGAPNPDTSGYDFKGANYSGLDTLSFTVFAADRNTRCLSDPETVTIVTNIPAVSINLVINDQTSCDPTNPNGAVSATPDTAPVGAGGEPAGGYTFRWFNGQFAPGSHPADPPDIAEDPSSTSTSSNIAGLNQGFYTIFVTNSNSGCESQEEAFLNEILVNPVLDVPTTTPMTSCAASNGTVSATVGGGTVGFDFYWFDRILGAPNPDTTGNDFKGAAYIGLDTMSYTVFAVDQNTRCISNPESITITPLITPVAIATVAMDQIACAPGVFTGEVTATPAGGATDYNIRWFRGQFAPNSHPADPPDFGPDNNVALSTITSLSKGFYTAFVTNNDDGCEGQAEAFVDSITVVPVAQIDMTSPMTSCLAPNRDATASALTGGMAPPLGFDFYWYDGTVGTADTTIADYPDKDNLLENLDSLDYTVFAVDRQTRCISNGVPFSIAPLITPVAIATVAMDQTACAPGVFTGEVTATPAGGATDYNIRWFRGQFAPNSHPADPPDFGPDNNVALSTITSLSKGFYTAFVTNNDDGCEGQAEAFVDSITVVPVAQIDMTSPMTSCLAPNRDATASALTGGVPAALGYDFYWYTGIVGTADTTAADFPIVAAMVTGLDSIQHTVFAADRETRCLSAGVNFTIGSNFDFPAITITRLAEQTACNPADSNGIFLAQAASVVEPSAYTFNWYFGQNTLPASLLYTASTDGVTGLTANNLGASVFRAQAINEDTGCESVVDTTMSQNIVLPVLDPLVTSPQTNCYVPDGSISATATVGGGPPPLGFDFYWFDGQTGVTEPDTLTADFGKTSPYAGLSAGLYTVVAVDKFTRCMSDSASAEVIFNPEPLTTAITNTSIPTLAIPRDNFN